MNPATEPHSPFARLASDWQNPRAGAWRVLARMNEARLSFLFAAAEERFDTLEGKSALDVGCGGGLVAEPLVRAGMRVRGIDAEPNTLAQAEARLADAFKRQPPRGRIEFAATDAESEVQGARRFDLVACLEVIEHVPDLPRFANALRSLVAPGGLLVVSTMNRTLRSHFFDIVLPESVLGLVPKGTHTWSDFVTPAELEALLCNPAARVPALEPLGSAGLVPAAGASGWRLAPHRLACNYIAAFAKPLRSKPVRRAS